VNVSGPTPPVPPSSNIQPTSVNTTTPELQAVFKGLNITPESIVSVTVKKGGLAVVDVHAAAFEEIKKRLKDIRKTLMNTEELKKLMKALELPEDVLVLDDTTGGIFIVKEALEEIGENLTP